MKTLGSCWRSLSNNQAMDIMVKLQNITAESTDKEVSVEVNL